MKFKYLTIALLSTAMLGCASQEKQEVAVALDCTFPDSPQTAAPNWVCDEPVTNHEVYAVGYAKKSKAGVGFMKDVANNDARVKLAQQLQIKVSNLFKNYIGTTGSGDTETVDEVIQSVTKNVTAQNLTKTKIIKSRVSPAGGMYVLAVMDNTEVNKTAKSAVQTSHKNESALWQEFQADKAQNELSSIIDMINEQN